MESVKAMDLSVLIISLLQIWPFSKWTDSISLEGKSESSMQSKKTIKAVKNTVASHKDYWPKTNPKIQAKCLQLCTINPTQFRWIHWNNKFHQSEIYHLPKEASSHRNYRLQSLCLWNQCHKSNYHRCLYLLNQNEKIEVIFHNICVYLGGAWVNWNPDE